MLVAYFVLTIIVNNPTVTQRSPMLWPRLLSPTEAGPLHCDAGRRQVSRVAEWATKRPIAIVKARILQLLQRS